MEPNPKHGAPFKKSPALAPALVTLHPLQNIVGVAIGAALRVFSVKDRCPVKLIDNTSPSRHGDAIRSVAFDASGAFFASGGDDKLLKIWSVGDDWTCLHTVRVSKKITCILFSKDSKWVAFADKYGSVGVIPTTAQPLSIPDQPTSKFNETLESAHPSEPAELLAHCCSIITSMDISYDGKYIATGDRDSKIRVSLFPSNPIHGAFEIESYCLAHTSFITCLKFLKSTENFLTSGGGDGTIRLWDPSNGDLLDSLNLAKGKRMSDDTQSSLNDNDDSSSHSESKRAIIALAASTFHTSICFAIIDKSPEIFSIHCNYSEKRLSLHQRILLNENEPPPTSIFPTPFIPNGEWLWSVSGAVECLEDKDAILSPEDIKKEEDKANSMASSAYVRVLLFKSIKTNKSIPKDLESKESIENGEKSAGCDHEDGRNEDIKSVKYTLLEGNERFGLAGEEMIEFLQGSLDENKVLAMVKTSAIMAEEAIVSELSKRTFTQEERERRKKGRNDKK